MGERARAQIRSALDAIITIDDRGFVVEWNPAAERIFGYSASEAVGTELAELIIPDRLIGAHRGGMAHYFATGEGPALDQRLELPGRRADGTEITVELTITAFEAEGKQWFTGYARDISELKMMRDELELSEQRFRAIVEGSSDVITILNADGSWRFTSESGSRLTGYPKGLDPEGGIFSLLHPDDIELAQQAMTEVMTGARNATDAIELRVIAADGSTRWFETTGVNMLDDPAVAGIVLHARDVTDRRAADDAVRLKTGQMAGIMGSLDTGVLVEDESRHVVAANRSFARLFDSPITADDMVGADCTVVAHGAKALFKDPDGFVAIIDDTIAAGNPVRGELLAMCDGRFLERDYVPVTDLGHTKGHIWLYRDVTQERTMAHRREEMLELERSARQRLEEQNQALRELDELKTQLVATVSHELRTPLASIVSFVELLADSPKTDHSEDDARFIDAISRNAHRLMQLVEDLLLLARLEANAIGLQTEPLDVVTLVTDLAGNLGPRADAKKVSIAIRAAEPITLHADRMKLTQVFDNLLSNAVKFTPEGGSVLVTMRRSAEGASVEISDTGIGIPAADQAQLFERFFRATNARTTMVPGSGLGLAVTKGLVELHRGTITVASIEGEGTTVTVDLPEEPTDG